MANIIYTSFHKQCADGTFDLDSPGAVFKCALLSSAHAPSAAHATLADVVANEVAGAGYTAGGAALTNVTWSVVGATAVFDADDPIWVNATISARYAVIYLVGTSNGVTNPLMCLIDFGAVNGVTGGTYRVKFNDAGILILN